MKGKDANRKILCFLIIIVMCLAITSIVVASPKKSKDVKDIYNSDLNIIFEGTPMILENHRMYQVVDLKKGYKNAVMYAERVGGHLAIVDSPQKSRMLRNFLKVQNIKFAYIGIEDIDGDGIWKDIYGRDLDFAYWHRHEPIQERGFHSYAMIARKHKDGTWLTGPFSRLVEGYERGTAFIIEWDKELNPQVYIPPGKILANSNDIINSPNVKKEAVAGESDWVLVSSDSEDNYDEEEISG